MNRLWKYELLPKPSVGAQRVQMPAGSKVLSLHLQRGCPAIWAEVTPGADAEFRFFQFVMTGDPIPHNVVAFIGTVLLDNGGFVIHLYEVADDA